MTKKAILVVSFGTSYHDTGEANIGAVENKIKSTFPDYDVKRAFTSNMIIKKIRQRDNIIIDTPEEALLKIKDENYEEVIVQPLHIIPGEEYEKILFVYNKHKDSFKKITIGKPILYNINHYNEAIEALRFQLPILNDDSAVVLMGHGSEHFANACYSCLQQFLNDAKLNVFVGTVEGYPEIDKIIRILKERKIKKVTLMPYMLVAGDHARNDMASEDEDSWKSILIKEGFEVNVYLYGLGENLEYQKIYVNRVREAIND